LYCRLLKKTTGTKRVFIFDYTVSLRSWVPTLTQCFILVLDLDSSPTTARRQSSRHTRDPPACLPRPHRFVLQSFALLCIILFYLYGHRCRAPWTSLRPDAQVGRTCVYKHLGAEAEKHLADRARLVNVWKPLHSPDLDNPLAVADYRSIDPQKDLVPSELRYKSGFVGETFRVKYNPNQRFYYVSQMQPTEALLLKSGTTK
jgi:hypothetical protein